MVYYYLFMGLLGVALVLWTLAALRDGEGDGEDSGE